MNTRTLFSAEEIKAFEPAEKIGLVAGVSPQGLPHISLITSIMAASPAQLTLGEFCKGMSKQYIQRNPKVAFLIMTLDRKIWRGKAKWTHTRKDGPEYEKYNEMPLFRYNAYFGINTVHYLDLVETSDGERLPVPLITRAALITKFAKGAAATGIKERILKPFAEDLFNKLDSLKFIAYVGGDGFPIIAPVIQCQAADSRRLVFSPRAYGEELSEIPKGAHVAVFGLTMGMEDVLVRGTFAGFKRYRFFRMGAVDIDWVYNSMPPCHGQIYPEVELKPVEEF
ncbi:pyridoxamine 5'-phosphate oxidase family protein [Candidatus Poribacteria bacterium]|nr:pyridoxamine 5'-phosphate oxidase family protein [Candidatus Poribacteria bacterium]